MPRPGRGIRKGRHGAKPPLTDPCGPGIPNPLTAPSPAKQAPPALNKRRRWQAGAPTGQLRLGDVNGDLSPFRCDRAAGLNYPSVNTRLVDRGSKTAGIAQTRTSISDPCTASGADRWGQCITVPWYVDHTDFQPRERRRGHVDAATITSGHPRSQACHPPRPAWHKANYPAAGAQTYYPAISP